MSTPRHPVHSGRSLIESDEARFQVAATQLLGGLFVLLKVSLVHSMDNRAVEPAVRRFRVALDQFQRQCAAEAALQFVGDAAYVNQRLIRADLDTWEKARFLKEFFARMQIAEISFEGEVPDQSVRAFIQASREVALDPTKVREFRAQAYQGISFRDLDAQGTRADDEALVLPDPVRVLRGYGIIVVTARDLVDRLQRGDKAPLLPIRRAVQEFARLPDRTRALQLGVLSLEHYRGELAGRLAYVAVMTVMMGRRMGLAAGDLREVGVTAALVGIGRAFVDGLAFAPPDVCAARNAYVDGARRLLPFSGHGRAAALRLIAAHDQSFPELRRAGHPISQMIAVAEAYELLTQRPPNGPGLQPDVALQQVLDSGHFSRAAGRLLVCTLGLFPVGTTVRLSTGETAVVIDVPEETGELSEPRVVVVADPQGAPVQGLTRDLAGSGITIVGTMDAAKIDLNVGHFLFA